MLRTAPLAFKALVCSRSSAARNNILESDSDILVEPETMVLSEMVFQTSQRVEMLTGYALDMNNDPLLSSPLWETIDVSKIDEKDTVICRLVYVDLPELGMTTPEDFKLPIQNQVFIIAPSDIKIPKATMPNQVELAAGINVTTKNELSQNIKYATSNIVKQSPDKDSLNALAGPNTPGTQPVRTNRTADSVTPAGGY